jgi:5-methylcytosine-specific restriction endonuclease McrA
VKTCRICQIKKPVNEFYLHRGGRSKGHRTECKDCFKEQVRQRANTDRVRAHRRERYSKIESLKQKVLARQNAYAQQNRKREADRAKKWRKDNPDKLKKLNRDYVAKNRDALAVKRKRYWAENHDKVMILVKRRKARLRGAQIAPFTARQWADRLAEFNHRCAYCWAIEKMTQDHVIPIIRGGRHSIDNIVPACERCNYRKGKKTLLEFLREVA